MEKIRNKKSALKKPSTRTWLNPCILWAEFPCVRPCHEALEAVEKRKKIVFEKTYESHVHSHTHILKLPLLQMRPRAVCPTCNHWVGSSKLRFATAALSSPHLCDRARSVRVWGGRENKQNKNKRQKHFNKQNFKDLAACYSRSRTWKRSARCDFACCSSL